ncbi:MAG: SH3 domain-containing protein [Clostridia bacterium]|nr:SH3 domain-containing protein [Clostridia bacterium]
MTSFFDRARALREAEAPLAERYESLVAEAPSEVERALARHLADFQRMQLAFLAFLETRLPDEVRWLAQIGEDEVKLREGPGPAHRVLRELAKGTPCLVVGFQGFWARLELADGTRGWAFREYVECERQVGPASDEADGPPPRVPGRAEDGRPRARRSPLRLR